MTYLPSPWPIGTALVVTSEPHYRSGRGRNRHFLGDDRVTVGTVVTTASTNLDYDGDQTIEFGDNGYRTVIDPACLAPVPPVEPDLDTRIEAARAALAALEEEKKAAERITLSLSRRDATVLREITAYISGTREGPRGASARIANALEDLGVQRDRRLVEPSRGSDIRLVSEWPTPLEPGESTW